MIEEIDIYKIISIFAIILMIISSVSGIVYYYLSSVNECTRSPFVYGARQMEKRYGTKGYIGSGGFIGFPYPLFYFDSKNITITTSGGR